jgi:HSP20 family molecular chaperone IbpA
MDTVLTPPQSSNGHKPSPEKAVSQAGRRDILEDLVAEPVSVQESATIPTNLIDGWASYYLQLSLPALEVESVEIQIVARRVLVRGKYTVPVAEDGIPTSSRASCRAPSVRRSRCRAKWMVAMPRPGTIGAS